MSIPAQRSGATFAGSASFGMRTYDDSVGLSYRQQFHQSTHSSLRPHSRVLRISTLAIHTVDSLILTQLELSTVARPTSPIVSAVPCPTNPVTNLPLLLARPHGDNISDEFVAETLDLTAGKTGQAMQLIKLERVEDRNLRWTKVSIQNVRIAMAYATSQHLEQNLTCLGFLQFKLRDLERLIHARDNSRLVFLREGARHVVCRFGCGLGL